MKNGFTTGSCAAAAAKAASLMVFENNDIEIFRDLRIDSELADKGAKK